MSAIEGRPDNNCSVRAFLLLTHSGHRDAFAERDAGFLHCGLMLAIRITLAHFSVSSAMSFPKSADEPAITVPPRSASRAFIFGSVRAALISVLSLPMISAGVFFGAPMPAHALAS